MTRAHVAGPLARGPRTLRLFAAICFAFLLPVAAAAQDQRAFLALAVNGVTQDDTLVVLRGSDALIGVPALTAAGLRGFDGRRETIDGTEFVSLASLAPRVTFAVDEIELRLAIAVDPDLLGVVVRNLDSGPPADIVYRSAPSLFLNYAATAGSGSDYELFSEAGLSARGLLFYTTTTRNPKTTVRGLSQVTIDRRSRLQRWVIGDNFSTAGPLGGDTLLAGITVGREFSLEPYFIRHPTMSVSTPVSTPSVLEVHVNGRLVREEQVQPGRLDLQNLPMVTGRNETRLVLRDPFGATREITSGFYLSTTTLARGVHDYQYSLGWRRVGFGTANWDYRAPVAVARHRVGITNGLTAGVRLEGTRELVSAGPSLNLRLPAGEIEVAAGASRTAGVWGSAGQVSYSYAGSHVSFGALVTRVGPEYATISLRREDNRPDTSFNAFASIPTGASTSVTLQHSEALGSEEIAQSRTSILGSARLLRRADLVASVTRIRGQQEPGIEVSAGVTIALGPQTTASVSGLRTRAGSQALIDVQRPLPVGTGVGYQFRAETGDHTRASGVAQYQGSYGRYEVRRDASGSAGRTTVSVSGGLVAIGGALHASRAVRNSYALVQVPGVSGVHAFSSNQDVGRTNRRGSLLVPDLLPYYGNRIAIDDTDIPIDFQVPAVQLTLAPPYRGGAVALFAVRRIQRISGRVTLGDGGDDRRLAYGNLTVAANGETVSSPLAADGAFYLENLSAGRHQGTVTFGDASCTVSLDVPVTDSAAITLGMLICRETDKR